MALGAHLLSPPSPSMLSLTGIQSYGDTEQTEESRNRRRANDGDRTGDPPDQKAAQQTSEIRLLSDLRNSFSRFGSRKKIPFHRPVLVREHR